MDYTAIYWMKRRCGRDGGVWGELGIGQIASVGGQNARIAVPPPLRPEGGRNRWERMGISGNGWVQTTRCSVSGMESVMKSRKSLISLTSLIPVINITGNSDLN